MFPISKSNYNFPITKMHAACGEGHIGASDTRRDPTLACFHLLLPQTSAQRFGYAFFLNRAEMWTFHTSFSIDGKDLFMLAPGGGLY